jgi:hypothetical protein
VTTAKRTPGSSPGILLIAEEYEMKNYPVLLMISLAALFACTGEMTLQQTVEKQMKEDGMDGFNIIHMTENVDDALVLLTSWTEEYPDNRNRPGIYYYQKQDGQWQQATGTDCSGGITRLGLLGNGYLYCSSLEPGTGFEKILVDGEEAGMFVVNDNIRTWFHVADNNEAKVIGVNTGGKQVNLN